MQLPVRILTRRTLSAAVLSTALLLPLPPMSAQQNTSLSAAREIAHQSPEWANIARHLPDPATAAPKELEMQADILRARRFPEDALAFYGYALQRGGDSGSLYKKLGVTHLELKNIVLAQLYFQKAVKLNSKDAEAWNNLGATEYVSRQYSAAVGDYKKSVKLSKDSAVYHSNLGMAYFDEKNFRKARKELQTALKLDPLIFSRGSSSGVSAHVLSPEDRARFCLEMAKTYALAGNDAEMIHSLSMASENGIDLLAALSRDKTMAAYRSDPRVLILVQNQKALRGSQAGLTQVGAVQPLAPAVN
jgi:tetratricopeptide (TPR) repeat protein